MKFQVKHPENNELWEIIITERIQKKNHPAINKTLLQSMLRRLSPQEMKKLQKELNGIIVSRDNISMVWEFIGNNQIEVVSILDEIIQIQE